MAVASALSPFFRAIGQAFGIAIADAIYQNTLKACLLSASSGALRFLGPTVAKDTAALSFWLQRLEDLGTVESGELLATFNKSLHAVWWALTAISLIGGLLSLLIRELSLGQREASRVDNALIDSEKGVPAEGVAQSKAKTLQPALEPVPRCMPGR